MTVPFSTVNLRNIIYNPGIDDRFPGLFLPYTYTIMKLFAFLSLLGLFTVQSVCAIVPKVEYMPKCVIVNGVERDDTCTRVSVVLQNYFKYWVRIPSTAFLHAVGDTTIRYRVKGSEDITLDKKIRMPASGLHPGTLVFEKVPDNVNVVDLVIDGLDNPKSSVRGIHLDEADTTVYPRLLSAADLFNSNERPAEEWTDFDPSRYKDMSFYKKGGMTHLRGRIVDYSPRSNVNTFTIRTQDDITNEQNNYVVSINADGTFAMDIPVSYAQSDYMSMGNIHRYIYLIPGDTLSIVTSLRQRMRSGSDFVQDCFGYEGDVDDGIAINLLADSIASHYGLHDLYLNLKPERSDSMAAQIYAANERLSVLFDSVAADLPVLLRDLPVSGFAKDVLSCMALGSIWRVVEEFDLDFRFAKGQRQEKDSLGRVVTLPGEKLDIAKILSPHRKYMDVIYDNPLLLCNGMLLPNRWKSNSVFRQTSLAAQGVVRKNGVWSYLDSSNGGILALKSDISRLDSLGVGNCFVAQFVRTLGLTQFINQSTADNVEIRLSRINTLIANLLKNIDYGVLDDAALSAYGAYMKKVAKYESQQAASEEISIDTSAYGGVLEKIIAPYKGNVLFLDFWGIGCGSCRAGMIDQKSLLEKYADKPFKALYIANGDEDRAAHEKWMTKENIKGEHIFVTDDDWNRLQGLLNFSGIPFGAYVDKSGKVIKTGVRHINQRELDRLISE